MDGDAAAVLVQSATTTLAVGGEVEDRFVTPVEGGKLPAISRR
jgi:hypothetical protein